MNGHQAFETNWTNMEPMLRRYQSLLCGTVWASSFVAMCIWLRYGASVVGDLVLILDPAVVALFGAISIATVLVLRSRAGRFGTVATMFVGVSVISTLLYVCSFPYFVLMHTADLEVNLTAFAENGDQIIPFDASADGGSLRGEANAQGVRLVVHQEIRHENGLLFARLVADPIAITVGADGYETTTVQVGGLRRRFFGNRVPHSAPPVTVAVQLKAKAK